MTKAERGTKTHLWHDMFNFFKLYDNKAIIGLYWLFMFAGGAFYRFFFETGVFVNK